jgi:thioredoxin-related protein
MLPLPVLASLVLLAPIQSQPQAPAAVPTQGQSPAQAKAPAQEKKPVYDESAKGSEQIAAALAKAKRDNKRVLVQWGYNACSWCVLLHGLMQRDQTLSRELLYEYEVAKIDIGGRGDKHQDLVQQYGAALAKHGVPYLTVLDADGKVLANQETEVFELPKDQPPGHDAANVLAFLKTYDPKPLVADEVLKGALASAAQEDKRVFLHFGAPWCHWCHRLEDWLAQPEVAAIVGKGFIDCKIDLDRMTGGKDALKRFNSDENYGVPWCAILDKTGAALVTSDGPNGNIGFPTKDEEIAYFAAMLRKADTKLGADDIAALERSLVASRAPQTR